MPTVNIVDGPFGSNLKASEYRADGSPILRLQNIKRFTFIPKNIKFIEESKAQQLTRHEFVGGDIIITKLGTPLGEACILPENIRSGIIVADLVRLRLDNSQIDKKWLMYAINSPDVARQFKDMTKGTTRPRVNLGHIRSLQFWLPPLREQRRIVAKIEELLSELDKGVEALTTAREQLKAYRQSVLKHAFEGKLTEKWCARNPGREQTQAQMLASIQSDARKRYDDAIRAWEATRRVAQT
jgi:type I restriction enzyme S subunit